MKFIKSFIFLLMFSVPVLAGNKYTVNIQNFSFSPSSLNVSVGDTVVWVNKDGTAHTTTANSGLWNSGNLSTNASFSFVFNDPGTYSYICNIHPSMTGSIIVSTVTGITDGKITLPEGFALSQNYPNPFNNSTRIQYTIPEAGIISLKIFDLKGREITTLMEDQATNGAHNTTWNGRNELNEVTASGLYFVILRYKNFTLSRKITLLK